MKKLLLVVVLIGFSLFSALFLIKNKKETQNFLKGGEKKMRTEKFGKILMVLAPKNFRDEEYQKPRKVLEAMGLMVTVASKGTNEAIGMLGAKAKVDLDLSQVKIDDYLGVVFVGGNGAASYFNDKDALSLAREAFEKGKIVGAICIAPSILANAGVLSGKKATAFYSEEKNLTEKGAIYTGEPVTINGKIVTANGPSAAEEFGRKLGEVVKSLGRD